MTTNRERNPGPLISAALMLHPARQDRVADIARGCAPIPLRIATDPEPAGTPSPLRTAKLAWAAAGDEATHHLVLQDDVELAPGFAGQVRRLVARWPDHAIALYVNWNSPYNSYRVRCAAMAGRPWAPLAPWEWIPTLGLVLPARHARGVAAHMRTLPDSYKSDDWAVAEYCMQHGVPAIAAVPHLLEHGRGKSVARNEWSPLRLATITGNLLTLPRDFRDAGVIAYDGAYHRYAAVALFKSRCYLKNWKLDGEPSLNVEQPPRTHWTDRREHSGIPQAKIESTFRARRCSGCAGPETEREFWVAGLTLGAEVGRALAQEGRSAPYPEVAVLQREAMRTWVASGLGCEDAERVGPAGQEQLVDLLLAAVQAGREYGFEAAMNAAASHDLAPVS